MVELKYFLGKKRDITEQIKIMVIQLQNFCGSPEGKLILLSIIQAICYSESFLPLGSETFATHIYS